MSKEKEFNRREFLRTDSLTSAVICLAGCRRQEEREVTDLNGNTFMIKLPYVLRELCIGCGACEYHCPAGGEAAIQVKTLPSNEVVIRGI